MWASKRQQWSQSAISLVSVASVKANAGLPPSGILLMNCHEVRTRPDLVKQFLYRVKLVVEHLVCRHTSLEVSAI